MDRKTKTLRVTLGLLLSAGPGAAFGQQPGELEALRSAVKAMEQNIEEMKRKLAEMEAQQAAMAAAAAARPQPGQPEPVKVTTDKGALAEESTKIPNVDTIADDQASSPRPGNAPLDPTYAGFIQLFGTNTWFKLGGYAKLDMIWDSTKVGNPNSFITSRIPVEGEPDFDKDAHFAMHAKQTRLNLELRSPTPLGSLKIFYENDFFNNSDQPSMDYRLRHFYGQVANLTVGQTWTTFYDPDANPDTLDFEGPGILPVSRQPQIRYTVPLVKDSMHVAFAAEQPKSDIYNVPAGGDGKNTIPDLVGQWRWANEQGHVHFAGIARRLAYDHSTGPTDNIIGWGLNLAGAVKIGAQDSLMASAGYGEGIGRYVQDLPSNSAAVIDANGQLHALPAYGFMVAYRHQWNEKWRSTTSYGYVQLDNRVEQGDFAYENTDYFQANLIWAPTKNMYVGMEYMYGQKQTRNGATGDDHRLQFSFQYKLIR